MQALPRDTGFVEVICGPMFSGKTEELIRRLRRALYARQKVQIFKPQLDKRYDEVAIVSHSQQQLAAIAVDDAKDILPQLDADAEVVAVDEAQFFDRNLVEVVQRCADAGKRVLCAGLDQDFTGAPFEPMPELMAVAEFVTKMLAICVVCGNPAGRSQRLTRQSRRVLVGAQQGYEARCRRCHSPQASLPEQGPLFAPPPQR
ncbi:MAG: thymidine kinase [Deltaproteobacteria bacterium]|nr:MAG: thymidine kinase [Deltaproteobacteria bacterium]